MLAILGDPLRDPAITPKQAACMPYYYLGDVWPGRHLGFRTRFWGRYCTVRNDFGASGFLRCFQDWRLVESKSKCFPSEVTEQTASRRSKIKLEFWWTVVAIFGAGQPVSGQEVLDPSRVPAGSQQDPSRTPALPRYCSARTVRVSGCLGISMQVCYGCMVNRNVVAGGQARPRWLIRISGASPKTTF